MRLCRVCTSSTDPQSSPLLIHDASCNGGPERNAGIAAHLEPRGSVTKPLPLPLVGGFGERAFWPESIGKLAHYSTAALRLFPIDHLGLHIEGLEP